jgi:hypothetical protein
VAADSDRVGALSEVAVGDERERVERILATAREMLGMQIAFFMEIDAGEQLIHRVAGDPGGLGLVAGTQVPLEDTYMRDLQMSVSALSTNSVRHDVVRTATGGVEVSFETA